MSGPYAMDELEGEGSEEARAATEAWLGELVVLSFRDNKRGGDPIAHTADGRAVFPDKYQGGDEILPGEHWVCSVSQKGESTFFAAPVTRLDANFFAELDPEERNRLARVVAEQYPDVLGEQIDEALQSANPPPADGLDDAAHERDELRERLAELSEQYDEAVARLRETENHLASLERQMHEKPREKDEPRGRDGKHEEAEHHKDARFPVRREGENTLLCEAFVEGNYHGHVSPNRRTLFFKAYGRGPLQCEEGRVEVPGLAEILDDGIQEMEARFDSRHGGFFVEIPRE